jgi:prevent-host-death family protein
MYLFVEMRFPMQKIIGVTDLQRRFRAVFDEVVKDRDYYVLTRSSRPEAVLIPYDDYVRFQQLQEGDVLRRVDEMIVRLAERNAGYDEEEVAADVAEALADVRAASEK